MNYLSQLLLAILLTSFSYFLGAFFITHGLSVWHSLVIGSSVVILGALVEKLRSPMWLIILTPFPVGMSLLFLFLNNSLSVWFLTYLITLFIYVILHIVGSFLFRFHSLIPAWKLGQSNK